VSNKYSVAMHALDDSFAFCLPIHRVLSCSSCLLLFLLLPSVYLLFDPDSEIDILNKHVFNTEAHPFKIFNN